LSDSLGIDGKIKAAAFYSNNKAAKVQNTEEIKKHVPCFNRVTEI